jgi:MFS family permease
MRSTGRNRVLGLIVLAEVLTAVAAVLTNVATNVLPASWQPYLWLAWPALVVLVAAGVVVAVRLYRADAVAVSTERVAQSRANMLKKLRDVWVDGVLDAVVYQHAIIELDLVDRPDLLTRTSDIRMDAPDEKPRPLDRDVALSDVVDRNRGLLVLGAPGAGKTTMLLTWLKDLLDRADRDAGAPIPVLFRLASWPSRAVPLAQWLVDELRGPLYGLPSDLAEEWIANDRVLPLLDGLDEVEPDHRPACARSIDDFHRANGHLPLIVSSRLVDYEALELHFSLGTALVIQPLTQTQTVEHLDRLGESVAGLREAMDREPSLWALLSTPFLFNVAARAYDGRPTADVATEGSPEHRQAELLAAFVDRALRRRQTGPRVESEAAVRVLSYLARGLGRDLALSVGIENVGVWWLPPWQRMLVKVATAIPSAILAGGAAGLLMGLFFGVPVGLGAGVLAGCGVGIALGMGKMPTPGYDTARDRRDDLGRDLKDFGFYAGLYAVLYGIALGLVGAAAGMVVGLVQAFAGSGPFFAPVGHWALVGLVAGALLALGAMADSAKSHYAPGLRDAAWLGGAFAVIVGVPVTTVLGLVYGSVGVLTGVVIALTVGYAYSGRPLTGYWLSRLLLTRAGVIPLRLPRFLDLAVDRSLMVQVGGRYSFTHRLVLEYFAGLEPPDMRADYLAAVDLRPHALLTRAVDEAREQPFLAKRLLSYNRDAVSVQVWAPAAMRVADAFAERLPAVLDPVPDTASAAPRAPVQDVLDVLEKIAKADHPELSAVAAVRFGELAIRQLAAGGEHGMWRWSLESSAVRVLTPHARSDATAAAVLRRLDEQCGSHWSTLI